MKQIEANGFSRISKAEARRRFYSNQDVYCKPSNQLPCEPYNTICHLNLAQPLEPETFAEPITFERAVNAFESTCCNATSGRYAAYYIQIEG